MLAHHVIVHLARPIRLLKQRFKPLESLLKTPINRQDEKSIREACTASGKAQLGEFYHWYLQKLIISKAIRGIDREKALSLIGSADASDYQSIRQITDSTAGVLVAVPHHAHYIFSIIALAERLRLHRRVYIFYGQPDTHQGNEVFDQLHTVIWGDESNVEVIHDTRQGLAKAIRGLKNGDVVFIMPDVFKQEESTLVIPFCGRPMSVMLGTATLARKTGAWILPVISTTHGRGMGFRTLFGERIDCHRHAAESENAEVIRIIDYRITRHIFAQCEKVMAKELLYWQNMRQHLAQEAGYKMPDKNELGVIADMLRFDPDIIWTTQVVDLRTKAS